MQAALPVETGRCRGPRLRGPARQARRAGACRRVIARAFHGWERRLASAATDRVVRPFEWGLDWLDPRRRARWRIRRRGSSDGRMRVWPTAARSIDAPPCDDYRARRRSADVSRARSRRRTPRTTSCARASFPERSPAGRRRAVLVLPQWNADAGGHVGLCRLLNQFRLSALRLTLPYHDERRPPELRRADYIVSANIGRTAQVCRQAVLDARRAIAWLAQQGYESIGILGTSLGSCLSMLTAAHEPLVRAAALNHISPYFADVVWSGLSTSHVRESLEGRIELDRLRRIWMPISPFPYLERVRGRRMLLVYARYDLTFPVALSRLLVDEFRRRDIDAPAAGAAVRPLQHRRDAVQVDGRSDAVPFPQPGALSRRGGCRAHARAAEPRARRASLGCRPDAVGACEAVELRPKPVRSGALSRLGQRYLSRPCMRPRHRFAGVIDLTRSAMTFARVSLSLGRGRRGGDRLRLPQPPSWLLVVSAGHHADAAAADLARGNVSPLRSRAVHDALNDLRLDGRCPISRFLAAPRRRCAQWWLRASSSPVGRVAARRCATPSALRLSAERRSALRLGHRARACRAPARSCRGRRRSRSAAGRDGCGCAPARVTSCFGQRQHGRHERREVVVGQLVEGELRRGAGDLLAGFEVARVAAGQRGAAEQQLLVRDGPVAADRLELADRFAARRRWSPPTARWPAARTGRRRAAGRSWYARRRCSPSSRAGSC